MIARGVSHLAEQWAKIAVSGRALFAGFADLKVAPIRLFDGNRKQRRAAAADARSRKR